MSAGQVLVDVEAELEGEEQEQKQVEPVDFGHVLAKVAKPTSVQLRDQFDQLARDHFCAFIGYDYPRPVSANLKNSNNLSNHILSTKQNVCPFFLKHPGTYKNSNGFQSSTTTTRLEIRGKVMLISF